MGAFGAPVGAFGAPVGAFGAPMGAFGAPMGAFGAPVGAFGEALGGNVPPMGLNGEPAGPHGEGLGLSRGGLGLDGAGLGLFGEESCPVFAGGVARPEPASQRLRDIVPPVYRLTLTALALFLCAPLLPDGLGPPVALAAGSASPPALGEEVDLKRLSPAVRVQYLVDLFEAARLLEDGTARSALWKALDLHVPERGEAATRAVLQRLAEDAKRAGRPALARLLRVDLAELEGQKTPFELAMERRQVASQSGDPAAGTALLDLFASCARALYDATQAQASQRAAIANHCLYALTTRDPAPYFAATASARPLDPPWRLYWEGLEALLGRARTAAPRLERLLDALDRWEKALRRQVELEGLEPPDPEELAPKLLAGPSGLLPYDRAAWVVVDGDLVVRGAARYTLRDHEMAEYLERLVSRETLSAGSDRRLTLFVSGESTADAIDVLAGAARRYLVGTIELALRGMPAAPVAAGVRESDFWPAGASVHLPGEPGADAAREQVVVLPLELATGRGRQRPRQLVTESLPATLVIRPEGLALRATDGEVVFSAKDLGAWLDRMRRAFPDAAELALAVDPTARYRDVVSAALAVRTRFRWLVLVEIPKVPHKGNFAERLRRRAGAQVIVRDAAGQTVEGADWLRGCYIDALERQPNPPNVTVRATLPEAAEITDPRLRACLQERARGLGELRKKALMVELRPE